ncbi:MAG: alkylhydroperoxidase-related (seleno)protein [Pseudomonadales bacterium]
MNQFAYDASPYQIPDYKSDAHRAAWSYLAGPGSWWTGTQRLAIAQASRDSMDCPFCAERKQALSPLAIEGNHNGDPSLTASSLSVSSLPIKVLNAVHRITTDPARLTESWIQGLIDETFHHGHYVETVSIISTLISIDAFHRALGLALEPLPAAQPGQPDRYWPEGAAVDVAWVPMIYPANLSDKESDIYFGAPQMGHVIRAMSLVPDAVRQLNALSAAHYLPTPQVGDMNATGYLTLSRPQTELIAARTSVLNDCFY